MYICLFEDDKTRQFEPFSLTRAVFDLRVGSSTTAELAKRVFPGASIIVHSRTTVAPAMARAYDCLSNHVPEGLDVLFLNSRWIPRRGDFTRRLKALAEANDGHAFLIGDQVVAAFVPAAGLKVNNAAVPMSKTLASLGLSTEQCDEKLLNGPWDIIDQLPGQIDRDFDAYSGGYNVFERPGAIIHESVILLRGEHIFVGDGGRIRPGVVLDAENGPIIIDKGAVVFENAVIRGPAYIGVNTQVHVGAYLKSVAIGSQCKVGGEILEAIVDSYSNKAHDGFLGHACVGRWCNLGAGTNNSNLRNDYGMVDAYDSETDTFAKTGRQFAGLLMGDHSKCSIGTMFNTGTVVGVCCNLYGSGFHPRMVPSFTWGGEQRYATYRFDKALRVAEIVMERRGKSIGEVESALLQTVYDESAKTRDDFLNRMPIA